MKGSIVGSAIRKAGTAGAARRMTPGGVISTLLNQDGVVSMAVDSKGNLYVSVFPNSYTDRAHIFEFSPAGFSPVGSKAEIPNPGSSGIAPAIAIDAADNLYITDQPADGGGFVWKRSPSGSVQKIAGKAGPAGLPGQGGPALEVTLAGPHALAFDRSGSLLIADFDGVLRLNPDGTLVRLFGRWRPQRIAPAADGSIYFIGGYYGISRWSAADGVTSFVGTQQSGFSDGCALSGGKRIAKYATFDPSDHLVFDTGGRLYVADNGFDASDPGRFYSYTAGRIRRIDPDGSIRTVAGTGSMPHESASGGPAIGAIYHNPRRSLPSRSLGGSGNVANAGLSERYGQGAGGPGLLGAREQNGSAASRGRSRRGRWRNGLDRRTMAYGPFRCAVRRLPAHGNAVRNRDGQTD